MYIVFNLNIFLVRELNRVILHNAIVSTQVTSNLGDIFITTNLCEIKRFEPTNTEEIAHNS